MASLASAAEGDLDPSFGSGGRVATPLENLAQLGDMVIDGQGRVVTVGDFNDSDDDDDLVVTRHFPNGALDQSFDGDGIAFFSSPGTPDDDDSRDTGAAVAIDSQGRILVFGDGGPQGDDHDFLLIRVLDDGTRDTAFGPPGSNGFVAMDLATDGEDEEGAAVALDAQGRIVVGGSADFGDFDFGVARFDAGGNLDTSFGSNGERLVDFTPEAGDVDEANAMAIDAQGRIVLVGSSRTAASGTDFALARLTSDGSRDPSFGNTPGRPGQVTTQITGIDRASAVAIDQQGRIIVAGETSTANSRFALARYLEDGSLDPTFSNDGIQITDFEGASRARSVEIDSQQRIVATGYQTQPPAAPAFALARYLPNGELDPTFGAAGKVTLAGGEGNAAAIDAQDRILVGGDAAFGAGNVRQYVYARFVGDAVAPTASLSSGPPDGALINDATPTFELASSEAGGTFSCGFDGFTAACLSPFTPTAALGDGTHTFTLTATDRAGNSSAALTRIFTVDTKAPEIEIKGKKKVKTRKPKARNKLKIKTSEPAELTCKVDKRQPQECVKRFITPKLREGKHKVKVEATDRAGNTTGETKKLKVVQKP